MKFKILYKEWTRNWFTIIDPSEREIMEKYANTGKLMGICYVGNTFINK